MLNTLASMAIFVLSAGSSGFDPQKLAELCTKPAYMSPGVTGRLDRYKVLRWLLTKNAVSDGARDEDGDGDITRRETIRAIAYPDSCLPGDPIAQQCAEADAVSLMTLHAIAAEFVGYADAKTRTEVDGKGWAIQFETIRRPTSAEEADYDVLNSEADDRREIEAAVAVPGSDTAAIAWFFAGETEIYRMTCERKDTPGDEIADAGADARRDPQPGRAPWTIAGRIRSKIDTLGQVLTDQNKEKLGGATIAYEDRAGGETKISIDAVLGLAFSTKLRDRRSLSLIPFVDIEASNLSGNTAKDPDRVGAGFGVSVEDLSGSVPWSLSGFVEYVTDTRFNASQGYALFTFEPTPDLPCFTAYWGPPGLPFQFGCQVDLRADIGELWDDGGAPAFVKLDDYARVGYRLGLSIRGTRRAHLRWLTGTVAYQNLQDLSGNELDLERFDASVKIAPSELKLFANTAVLGIEIKYTNGNADITLEQQEKVTVGFSLTY